MEVDGLHNFTILIDDSLLTKAGEARIRTGWADKVPWPKRAVVHDMGRNMFCIQHARGGRAACTIGREAVANERK